VTDERRERILAMIATLEAEGDADPSAAAVWARVQGHRPDVQAVVREYRAERSGGSIATAEADEEEEETSAASLAEDLRQLEAAYEGWHLSIESIWTFSSTGTEISGRDSVGKRPLHRLIDFAASERESYQKGCQKQQGWKPAKSRSFLQRFGPLQRISCLIDKPANALYSGQLV